MIINKDTIDDEIQRIEDDQLLLNIRILAIKQYQTKLQEKKIQKRFK